VRVIRGPLPEDNFTVVPNSVLERKDLSWAAKGLYVWLRSRPDGWETSAKRIAETYEGGDHLVRGALKQLETAGLVVREKYRDDLGQWAWALKIGGAHTAKIAPGLTREGVISHEWITAPISKKENTYAAEPLVLIAEVQEQTRVDPIVEVFEAWRDSMPGAQRSLTDSRKAAIARALKSWPVDDRADAVRGWRFDPWPGRKDQNSIEILLRPANIEKFRDLWRANQKPFDPLDEDQMPANDAPSEEWDAWDERCRLWRETHRAL